MRSLLNGKWKYILDLDDIGDKDENEGWWAPKWIEDNKDKAKVIDLPNCWNIIPELDKFEGIIWFYKEFTDIPGYSNTYDLYLQFKAVNYFTKVWINGVEFGENEGGFLPFQFKLIPELLNLGEKNYLAVRVDNFIKKDRIPGLSYDWYNWGGIYRDISFIISDKFRIEWAGIKTRILEDGSSKAEIKYELVDNREKSSSSKEIPHEIKWNLYYLGDISTKNNLSITDSEKSKIINNENGSNYLIPKDIEPIDMNAIDNMNIDENQELKSDIEDEENNTDILDDLLRESITMDDFEVVKAEQRFADREQLGVLIKSGSVSGNARKGIFNFSIHGQKLWNPKDPELYQLELLLKGSNESYLIRFGFREIKTIGPNLYLNNSRIRIYGVNLHEELMPYGRTIPIEKRRKDILHIKSLGFNSVRAAHYPHDESFLKIADEEGLFVLSEIPVYQGIDFSNTKLLKLAAKMLRKMIRRDFNHPSIIMWSVGNEINIDNRACSQFIETLMKLAKNMDDSRLISFVMDFFGSLICNRNLLKIADIFCTNQYFGWYLLSAYNLNSYLDTVHTKTLSKSTNKPWMLTEFGGGAKIGFHSSIEKYLKYSEERQASIISHSIKVVNSKDYMTGYFIWIYRDFRSHKRTNRYQEGYNRKGIVNEQNNPKIIAKSMSKIYNQKFQKEEIHNYLLLAALMRIGVWPLIKLISLIIHFIYKKTNTKKNEFYTNIPQIKED